MIPLHKVFMPNNIEKELTNILYSGKLSYGKYSKSFERELRDFIGNQLVLAISANPVMFALQLLNIKEGDEVIASPMSCLMTTQPINLCGAKVKWCDIDPNTGTLEPDQVVKNITAKTKAIIHYHWAGYPGYISEINKIGKSYGIPIIEEASTALGSEYNEKKVGNTGSDIVCFSFSPIRLPNTIDGSGLSFGNKELFEKAKIFRDLGIKREFFRDDVGEISNTYDVEHVGTNATLNDLSGYIGSKQMKTLENLLEKQRVNGQAWLTKLHDVKNVTFLCNRKEINPNFWVFSFNIKHGRDTLLKKFRNNGYYASKIHIRNDMYSVFNVSRKPELLGVKKFSKTQINIPSGWWVNTLDIQNYG